jgi:hypothetical protein
VSDYHNLRPLIRGLERQARATRIAQHRARLRDTPLLRYQAPATGKRIQAGMNYLRNLIVRPGIQKIFGPLLAYRGCMNRGHAHRLWNFALLMMACECETLSDGLRVVNNPAYAQLCGPPKVPQKQHLWSYFGRLYDNPAVTNNIEGFTDYVRSMGLGPSLLIRVDRFTQERECAEWRVSLHPNAGEPVRERGIAPLFYPYMLHDPQKPDDGAAIVKLVNQAVPWNWPEQIRADVCQEIIVGLLSGDVSVGGLHDAVAAYWRKHFKTQPRVYEAGLKLSFSAPMPGTADLAWTERI